MQLCKHTSVAACSECTLRPVLTRSTDAAGHGVNANATANASAAAHTGAERKEACLLWMQVGAVLHHIEAGNLLPPLVVLSILAKNPNLQLSIVKDYIARQLSAESAHIQEDRAQIAKYQQETAHMKAEVRELRTEVTQGCRLTRLDFLMFAKVC